MQLIADYFPLILFFLAFKWQGIMVATGVAIAASIAQIAWFKWKGKVSPVHLLSLAIIVVFGGATLLVSALMNDGPESTGKLVAGAINELVVPVGCALILFATSVLAERLNPG